MEKEFWHNLWNTNDIKFNQLNVNPYLRYFIESDQCNWDKKSTIFVPLCGKSIDMKFLVSLGYNVVGVELNKRAVEDFFIENEMDFYRKKINNFEVFESEKICIYQGDIFNLNNNILGEINYIYDRACLIAFAHQLRKEYSNQLITLTPKVDEMFLVSFIGNQDSLVGPPFNVEAFDIIDLYKESFEINFYGQVLRKYPERRFNHAIHDIYLLKKHR